VHGRRKFFVLADLRQVPLAIEAVRRIDEILFRCAGIADHDLAR
jgi:hypothetical protein